MNWRGFIFAILMLFALNARAATQTNKVTVTVTITNAPTTNGLTFTLNSNTRTWTNAVFNAALQIGTNATVAGSITNFYNSVANNGFVGVVIQNLTTNSVDLVGASALAMNASVSANWSTLSYSTQLVTAAYDLRLPIDAEPTASTRTNHANDVVTMLNNYATETLNGFGVTIAAGTNTTAQTNANVVTINAAVGLPDLIAATNPVPGEISSAVAAGTANMLTNVVAGTGVTVTGSGASRTISVTGGGSGANATNTMLRSLLTDSCVSNTYLVDFSLADAYDLTLFTNVMLAVTNYTGNATQLEERVLVLHGGDGWGVTFPSFWNWVNNGGNQLTPTNIPSGQSATVDLLSENSGNTVYAAVGLGQDANMDRDVTNYLGRLYPSQPILVSGTRRLTPTFQATNGIWSPISKMVFQLKTAGLWPLMDVIYPFAGSATNGSSLNLKTNAFAIKWTNSLANASAHGSWGISNAQNGSDSFSTGIGTNGYSTQIYSRTNRHLSVWVSSFDTTSIGTNNAGSADNVCSFVSMDYGNSNNATLSDFIAFKNTNTPCPDSFYYGVMYGIARSTTGSGCAAPSASIYNAIIVTNSFYAVAAKDAAVTFEQNSTVIQDPLAPGSPGGDTTNGMLIGAGFGSASGQFLPFGPKAEVLGFVSAGQGMTAIQLQNLYQIVAQYEVAMGRIITNGVGSIGAGVAPNQSGSFGRVTFPNPYGTNQIWNLTNNLTSAAGHKLNIDMSLGQTTGANSTFTVNGGSTVVGFPTNQLANGIQTFIGLGMRNGDYITITHTNLNAALDPTVYGYPWDPNP